MKEQDLNSVDINFLRRLRLNLNITVIKMNITYKDTQDFEREHLTELFLSVKWSSGKYPDMLKEAMKNYKTVYSAWDNDRLVGLISVMDDGVMTAYVHYLLVNPDYQRFGIGRKLIDMTKEKYKDYLKIVLIAYDSAMEFYNSCGFEKSDNATPMALSSMAD